MKYITIYMLLSLMHETYCINNENLFLYSKNILLYSKIKKLKT